MCCACLQVVRELELPEDWPGEGDNHLGLLVSETVKVRSCVQRQLLYLLEILQ